MVPKLQRVGDDEPVGKSITLDSFFILVIVLPLSAYPLDGILMPVKDFADPVIVKPVIALLDPHILTSALASSEVVIVPPVIVLAVFIHKFIEETPEAVTVPATILLF